MPRPTGPIKRAAVIIFHHGVFRENRAGLIRFLSLPRVMTGNRLMTSSVELSERLCENKDSFSKGGKSLVKIAELSHLIIESVEILRLLSEL